MKRITWWPQIVLGLAFSWGALMGLAVSLRPARCRPRSCSMPASIAWVIGYDTIYAHQDARGRRADRHQVDRAPVRRRVRIGR